MATYYGVTPSYNVHGEGFDDKTRRLTGSTIKQYEVDDETYDPELPSYLQHLNGPVFHVNFKTDSEEDLVPVKNGSCHEAGRDAAD